jgi:hypothetical protein
VSQAAQDLLWVINSPSFVCGDDVAASRPLTEREVDVGALESFLATRQEHRVGRYFENLLHFWFAHIRQVEIVGAGVQIRDGKRTIGELDFLYRDEAGALIHCEAAVKYFLHHVRPGQSHYPGPNASDNFELKTTKLFDRQLQLSRAHYPDVQRREAFVKGMVFYHHGEPPPSGLPLRMPSAHLRGSWMHAGEMDHLAARPGLGGVVALKPHWLAPETEAIVTPIIDLVTQLRSHFDSADAHPVMVSVRSGASAAEIDRLFVVSDSWPDRGRVSVRI